MKTGNGQDLFAKTLTIYGRKPVLEALSDRSLAATALHVAQSNQSGGIIADIITCGRAAPGYDPSTHARYAGANIS